MRERVADGVYRYTLEPKDGKKAEVRYGATVWVRGPWGERVQRRKHGFATEKAAKTWRAQEIAASASGLAATGGELKLSAWIEQYLALNRGRWQPGTYRNQTVYLGMFDNLAHLPLAKLTPAHIGRRLVELGETLKPQSVRNARAMLSQCLKQAVDYGLIARNPVGAVKAPPIPPRDTQFWTAAEVNQLLTRTAGDADLAVICRILAECWLRVGELCGLTWADVDLTRRELHVRRTVRKATRGTEIGERGKTANAARTIPFSPELARLLRERQDRDRLSAGRGWTPNRTVLNDDGRYWETTRVRTILLRACRLAGLPGVGPHHLRHSGASIALRGDPERGIRPLNVKLVSERLGHANVAFTYRVYVHVDADDHRLAADVFAELISGVV